MSEAINWKKSGPFESGMTLWEAETQKGAVSIHTFGRNEFTLSLGSMNQLPYFKSFDSAAAAAEVYASFVPTKRSRKKSAAE